MNGAAVVENVQLVAAGLTAPWAIDLAPRWATLRPRARARTMRIVQLGQGGGLRTDPWGHCPASTSRDGEKGPPRARARPDFASNRFVYLYYSYVAPGGAHGNKLVRMRDANDRGVEETVMLDGIPEQQSRRRSGEVRSRRQALRGRPATLEKRANAQNASAFARQGPALEQGRFDPGRQPTAAPRSSRWAIARAGASPGIRTRERCTRPNRTPDPFPNCCQRRGQSHRARRQLRMADGARRRRRFPIPRPLVDMGAWKHGRSPVLRSRRGRGRSAGPSSSRRCAASICTASCSVTMGGPSSFRRNC